MYRVVEVHRLLLGLVACTGLGCGSEPVAVGPTISDQVTTQESNSRIELIAPRSAIQVPPATLHEIQVTVRNCGDEDLYGVHPRLPCNCHVASSLPGVFVAGSTHQIAFRTLSPIAGRQHSLFEFHDQSKKPVGKVSIELEATGEVPRMLHEFRPIRLSYVAGDSSHRIVNIQAVEKFGAAKFISQVRSVDGRILHVDEPAVAEQATPYGEYVLRNYAFPTYLLADVSESTRVELRLEFSEGLSPRDQPVSVEILERVHVIPAEVLLDVSRQPGTSPTKSSVMLVSRVHGEIYSLEHIDVSLLAADRVDRTDRNEWNIRLVGCDQTVTTSSLSFV